MWIKAKNLLWWEVLKVKGSLVIFAVGYVMYTVSDLADKELLISGICLSLDIGVCLSLKC